MLVPTVTVMVLMLRAFKNLHSFHSHLLTFMISGTAAGYEYGVAKKARIIAVKVLGDDGYVRPL